MPDKKTDIDDNKLINFVANHPVLYDATHKKYSDLTFKTSLWNKISRELNNTTEACRSRWCCIRDSYRKSLRKNLKRRQTGEVVKQYKYHDELEFLKDYTMLDINARPAPPSPSYFEEDNEMTYKNESPGSDNDDNEVLSVYHNSDESKVKIPFISTKEPGTQDYFNETHPIDVFLAGIAPTLKNLSPYYLNLAKSEIFATVQKYDMKMITENNTDQLNIS